MIGSMSGCSILSEAQFVGSCLRVGTVEVFSVALPFPFVELPERGQSLTSNIGIDERLMTLRLQLAKNRFATFVDIYAPALLKVRLMFIFVPLLEYRRRYGCVVFGVGNLSYYQTGIISDKREFYLKISWVTA